MLPSCRNQRNERFGHHFEPAVFFVEEVERFKLIGGDVGADEFLPGVTLPAIGGVACLEAGG
jgi:hypothetical protein